VVQKFRAGHQQYPIPVNLYFAVRIRQIHRGVRNCSMELQRNEPQSPSASLASARFFSLFGRKSLACFRCQKWKTSRIVDELQRNPPWWRLLTGWSGIQRYHGSGWK
jgi:hypothetical protein